MLDIIEAKFVTGKPHYFKTSSDADLDYFQSEKEKHHMLYRVRFGGQFEHPFEDAWVDHTTLVLLLMSEDHKRATVEFGTGRVWIPFKKRKSTVGAAIGIRCPNAFRGVLPEPPALLLSFAQLQDRAKWRKVGKTAGKVPLHFYSSTSFRQPWLNMPGDHQDAQAEEEEDIEFLASLVSLRNSKKASVTAKPLSRVVVHESSPAVPKTKVGNRITNLPELNPLDSIASGSGSLPDINVDELGTDELLLQILRYNELCNPDLDYPESSREIITNRFTQADLQLPRTEQNTTAQTKTTAGKRKTSTKQVEDNREPENHSSKKQKASGSSNVVGEEHLTADIGNFHPTWYSHAPLTVIYDIVHLGQANPGVSALVVCALDYQCSNIDDSYIHLQIDKPEVETAVSSDHWPKTVTVTALDGSYSRNGGQLVFGKLQFDHNSMFVIFPPYGNLFVTRFTSKPPSGRGLFSEAREERNISLGNGLRQDQYVCFCVCLFVCLFV